MQLTAQQYATVVQGLRDAAEASESDSRKFSRMTVHASVVVVAVVDGKPGARFTALTQDVSMGGLALLQSVVVNVGGEVVVELPGGGGRGKNMVVLATVAHCRPVVQGIFSVGLNFVKAMEGEMPQAGTAAPPPKAGAPAGKPATGAKPDKPGEAKPTETEQARIRNSILD